MPSSRRRFYCFVVVLYLVGGGFIAWAYSKEGHAGITVCPFKLLTAYPCPTCGTTRGLVRILQGEVGEGLRANPNALFPLLGLVALPIVFLWDLLDRRKCRLELLHQGWMSLWRAWWFVALFGLAEIAIWIHNFIIGN